MIDQGTIGQSCYISGTSGEGQNCDALAAAISTCQSNGVTIVLSIGGASGSYSLASDAQAETIAQYLWDSYGERIFSLHDALTLHEKVLLSDTL